MPKEPQSIPRDARRHPKIDSKSLRKRCRKRVCKKSSENKCAQTLFFAVRAFSGPNKQLGFARRVPKMSLLGPSRRPLFLLGELFGLTWAIFVTFVRLPRPIVGFWSLEGESRTDFRGPGSSPWVNFGRFSSVSPHFVPHMVRSTLARGGLCAAHRISNYYLVNTN